MKFNHEERRAGHTRRKNANNSTCSTPKMGNNDKYWINVNSSLLDEEVEMESVRSIIPADYLICSPLQLESLPSSTSSSASSMLPFPPNFSPRKRPKSAGSPRKRFFRQISPSGQVETFETLESRNDDETDNYDGIYDDNYDDDDDDTNTHGFMTIKAYAANLRIQEQLEKERSLPCLSPKKKQGNGKSPKEELLEEERQQQLQLTMMQYAETDDEMSTINPEERSRSVLSKFSTLKPERSRSVISILASIIPKGKCVEENDEEDENEDEDDDNTVVIATGRGDDGTGGGNNNSESNNNKDANANANATLCNSLSNDRSLRCFTDDDNDIDGDIETCQIEVVAVKDEKEEARSGRNTGLFSSLWRRGRTRLQLITTSTTKKKRKAWKMMDEHEENGDGGGRTTNDVEKGTVTDEENNNTNTNTNSITNKTKNDDYNKSVTDPTKNSINNKSKAVTDEENNNSNTNTHTKNDDYNNKSVTDPKNNSTNNKSKDENNDNNDNNDNIDDRDFQATSEERAAVKKLIEADGDPTTQHLVDTDNDTDNDTEENDEKNHNEEENVSQSLYIALLLFLVIVLLSWVLYYLSSVTPPPATMTPTPTSIPTPLPTPTSTPALSTPSTNDSAVISVSSQLLYTDTNVFRRRSDGLF